MWLQTLLLTFCGAIVAADYNTQHHGILGGRNDPSNVALGLCSNGTLNLNGQPPFNGSFLLNDTFPFNVSSLLPGSDATNFTFFFNVTFPSNINLPFNATSLFNGALPPNGTFLFNATLTCTPVSTSTSTSSSKTITFTPTPLHAQVNTNTRSDPSSHPPNFYFDRSFYRPLLALFQAIASIPPAVIRSGEAATSQWISDNTPDAGSMPLASNPPPTQSQLEPLGPYSYTTDLPAAKERRDLSSPTSLAVCASTMRKAFVGGMFSLAEVTDVKALFEQMDGPEGAVQQLLANAEGTPDPATATALEELLRLLSKVETVRKECFVQQ